MHPAILGQRDRAVSNPLFYFMRIYSNHLLIGYSLLHHALVTVSSYRWLGAVEFAS